mgnify:CR=1 FL=1
MWDRQTFMTTILNKKKHILFCFYQFQGPNNEKTLKEQIQSNIPSYLDLHFIEINSEFVLYETLTQKKLMSQYPCVLFYSKNNVSFYPTGIHNYIHDDILSFRQFLKQCNKMS